MDTETDQQLCQSVKDVTLSDVSETEIKQTVDDMLDKLEQKSSPSQAENDPLHISSAEESSSKGTDHYLRDKDSEAEDDNEEEDHKNRPDLPDDSKQTKTDKVSKPQPIGSKFERKRNQRPRTEKWGESTGIVDDSGRMKRVIATDELNNYLMLEMVGTRSEFRLYASLINERYPRFLDSTVDYLQRWRMRYNIFAANVMSDEADESLVHVGEIHLYFDLIPKYQTPYYVNNTFYENPTEFEGAVDPHKYSKVLDLVDRFRRSQYVYQLRFPIRLHLMHKTNDIFDKFEERQQELMEESRSVYRKAFLRRKRNDDQREDQIRRGSQTQSQSFGGSLSRGRDHGFGHSHRDNFASNRGQRRPRGERPQRPRNQELGGNRLNDREVNEKPNYSGQNRKGPNPRTNRVFRGNNDKRRGDSRLNYSAGHKANDDNDVMFEDTVEREERKTVDNYSEKKDHKGRDRRNDNFDSTYRTYRRDSGRSLDSVIKRFGDDHKAGNYSGARTPTGVSVMDMNAGRQHLQMAYGFPQSSNSMYPYH